MIPIHYDDLFTPVGETLVPSPALLDDAPAAFERILAWTHAREGRVFALLPWWKPALLFPR